MPQIKCTYLALLVLLSPMAANADPIVRTAPCVDYTAETCATGIDGLEIASEILNVDFVQGSFQSVYGGNTPYFFGSALNYVDSAQYAIEQALNSVGPIGAIGLGPASVIIIPDFDERVGDNMIQAIETYYRFQDPPGMRYWGWFATFSWPEEDFIYSPDNLGGAYFSWAVFEYVGQAASVPEPGTLALLGLGLAGIGVSRRRKR